MDRETLTVGELLAALEGTDPDAPVVVGIINGGRYNVAYAQKEAGAATPIAYICCHEEPRRWPEPGHEPTPAPPGGEA